MRPAAHAPCPDCSESYPWACAYRIGASSTWWCPTCHHRFDDDVIVEDREEERVENIFASGCWVPDWAVGQPEGNL